MIVFPHILACMFYVFCWKLHDDCVVIGCHVVLIMRSYFKSNSYAQLYVLGSKSLTDEIIWITNVVYYVLFVFTWTKFRNCDLINKLETCVKYKTFQSLGFRGLCVYPKPSWTISQLIKLKKIYSFCLQKYSAIYGCCCNGVFRIDKFPGSIRPDKWASLDNRSELIIMWKYQLPSKRNYAMIIREFISIILQGQFWLKKMTIWCPFNVPSDFKCFGDGL